MTAAPVQNVLGRLERLQSLGKRGWLARCPAHKDKTASLSIAEGRNGGVLLNCFGGCEVRHVLDALGLEFKDLYPRRATDDLSPQERAEIQFASDRAKWAAALDTLCQEATIVALAARDLAQGHEVDRQRVNKAYKLITRAQDALSVGPHRRRRPQWKPERKR